MPLLTRNNLKLLKSDTVGYVSYGIHLAPHKQGGKNLCPNASPGCIAGCLNGAGYGCYQRTRNARINKTHYFNNDKPAFISQTKQEILSKIKKSKDGVLSFRLNLTSDVHWEKIKTEGKNLMEHFPDVQFYDYTKNETRMLKFLSGDFPNNYHLVFSKSEINLEECKNVLSRGGQVAVVFKDKLPKKYLGKRVVDGTQHDMVFLQPKNCVIGLVALGPGKKDKSGFVVKKGNNQYSK